MEFNFTTFILILIPVLYLLRKYILGGVCNITKDLTGKVIIITGASAGIGLATAEILAKMNATIVFACRNEKKTKKVIEEIQQKTNNKNLHYINLELEDLETVTKFVKTFKS
jgi:NADP-dependent 3-hydroxy acid dehydrogenase YdfG